VQGLLAAGVRIRRIQLKSASELGGIKQGEPSMNNLEEHFNEIESKSEVIIISIEFWGSISIN